MTIKEISSLINVVSKNKVKQIEIIGEKYLAGNNITKLYELIIEGKLKSDEEGSKLFFDNNPNRVNYFNRLKRKLKSRLLNTLFFIDVNQPSFTDIQKAYYNCYREATAVKILMGRAARKPAVSLAEKTIKKSIKFDFTDITIELARFLRTHYSNIEGNKKKFLYYKKIVTKYSQIYQAELTAEEYYSDLMINFTGSQSTKPELLGTAEKYYTHLRNLTKKYSSYKMNLNSYLVFALRYEIKNDYRNTLAICDEAIKYFESRPHIASKVVIINFLFKRLGCFIMLKRFNEGEETAERCLKLQPKGSINWVIALHYYVILSFHSQNFKKAYDLYQDAINQFNIDNEIMSLAEYWKIHEAIINYLIAIKKLEVFQDNNSNRFRISKFLNDVPLYSKDKQGINIFILIIQVLFLLQQGKYGEIIDRTESLKTYVHRYLRRDDTFRSNCFIKMLLCLPAASFHKAGVVRKAKKYVELLKSVPIEEANQSPEVEIIPYEMLWEFVLESLDNKFH